jgi:hypothetical protein
MKPMEQQQQILTPIMMSDGLERMRLASVELRRKLGFANNRLTEEQQKIYLEEQRKLWLELNSPPKTE